MRSITESIIGRKSSKAIHKIKNPKFSDLTPYNIVKFSQVNDYITLYGIVIPRDQAKYLFGDIRYYPRNCSFIVQYNYVSKWLTFTTTDKYKRHFPEKYEGSLNYVIENIWRAGSYIKSYDLDKAKSADVFENLFEEWLNHPEEFENLLE